MKSQPGTTPAKAARTARRRRERAALNKRAEQNRLNAIGGGKPDSSGQIQGQNGEQGNTVRPWNTRALGKLEH